VISPGKCLDENVTALRAYYALAANRDTAGLLQVKFTREQWGISLLTPHGRRQVLTRGPKRGITWYHGSREIPQADKLTKGKKKGEGRDNKG